MSQRLWTVLFMALLALAGCTPSPDATIPPGRASTAPTRSVPATMPDLVGRSLQKVGAQLRGAGLRVIVVLPERELFADEQGRAARDRDGRTRRLTLPEERVPFGSKPGWAQLVAAQEPDVGTALSPTSTVVLIAGKHTGGNLSRPWVWEHVDTIKQKGAWACFERCHPESSCSHCHVEMLPD